MGVNPADLQSAAISHSATPTGVLRAPSTICCSLPLTRKIACETCSAKLTKRNRTRNRLITNRVLLPIELRQQTAIFCETRRISRRENSVKPRSDRCLHWVETCRYRTFFQIVRPPASSIAIPRPTSSARIRSASAKSRRSRAARRQPLLDPRNERLIVDLPIRKNEHAVDPLERGPGEGRESVLRPTRVCPAARSPDG